MLLIESDVTAVGNYVLFTNVPRKTALSVETVACYYYVAYVDSVDAIILFCCCYLCKIQLQLLLIKYSVITSAMFTNVYGEAVVSVDSISVYGAVVAAVNDMIVCCRRINWKL